LHWRKTLPSNIVIMPSLTSQMMHPWQSTR
jgi:hypothetical protein